MCGVDHVFQENSFCLFFSNLSERLVAVMKVKSHCSPLLKKLLYTLFTRRLNLAYSALKSLCSHSFVTSLQCLSFTVRKMMYDEFLHLHIHSFGIFQGGEGGVILEILR